MVTFDGDNKIVQVDDGVNELIVEKDVYIPWKEWVISNNTNYEETITKLGGDILVQYKLSMPIAYKMLNGWKIRPSEEQQILTIKSNLYTDDGSDPYVIPDGYEDLIIVNIETNVCGTDCPPTDAGTNGQCPDCGTNGNGGCGLDTDQDNKLTQITNQMDEVWRLMGLDKTAPVDVTKVSRITRDIDQDFDSDPDGNVTITRN